MNVSYVNNVYLKSSLMVP